MNGSREISWIIGTVLIVLGTLAASACTSFGRLPSEESLERIRRSPNWDGKSGRFVNRRQAEIDAQMGGYSMREMLGRWINGKEVRSPASALPELKPDLVEFLRDDGAMKFVWFGHSTLLLRLQGKTILFDPVFSNAASPVSFANKRFQPPVLPLAELPPIDFVVISHDHYDHLDHETVVHFAGMKGTHFVMPLGNAAYLEGWGIPRERITELDWWESLDQDGVKFNCTPSQHFSGRRGLWGQNATLWASWAVQAGGKSVYFSGDTGYDSHFTQIGEKLGPFDLAFIETGQYDPMWSMLHLMPGEGVRAFRDLRGKLLVPIHWGMFNMAFHAWNEPVEKLVESAEKEGAPYLVPRLGEVARVGAPGAGRPRWWLSLEP